MRIGLGVDQHQIRETKLNSASMPLTLGGLILNEESISLEGNSDGDVIIHALCNALSTAIGGGSLGPITDPMCLEEGVKESWNYLPYFLAAVEKAGYKIGNISISVEAQRPRLEKYRTAIVKRMAGILEVEIDQIGLAFTSGENLSAYGQGQGIMAQVIVLLEKI